MKLLIIIVTIVLLTVALTGCEESVDEQKNIDNRLIGHWVRNGWAYTITFSKDNTYTSNFIGSGTWNVNGSELMLGEYTFDYDFVGSNLHFMNLFFEKGLSS